MGKTVETAKAALTDALRNISAGSLALVRVAMDAGLPGPETPASCNVVLNPAPAQILAEQLGLGEDAIIVEWVQTFDIEWIVRDENEATRTERFTDGQAAIEAALYKDRTLGGAACGVNIGPPNYENHTIAGTPHTAACVIPVRVSLRGLSPLS